MKISFKDISSYDFEEITIDIISKSTKTFQCFYLEFMPPYKTLHKNHFEVFF